jgi:hypothetical protein
MSLKSLKFLAFCLVAILMMSCVPAIAAPGAAVKTEKHAVVKAALTVAVAYQAAINLFADVPALPAAVARVPKTKVYSLKKYFGMSIGSDISHQYRQANIIFRHNCLQPYIPPLIS